MTIRERLEQQERDILSACATLSAESRGRKTPEEEHFCRTCFQRDRDRILHSKSFRRLKHKTQVFLSPMGDHYRTRLTHTLEVAQIARTACRALALNEDLAEAIALGHDLGHTPFGHAGEEVLNRVCSSGFAHYEQSLRVVEKLETGYPNGLNLTFEVRDGIHRHEKGKRDILEPGPPGKPSTVEGEVVRLSDAIAYINHDIDDACRASIISLADLPQDALKLLGIRHSDRINTMVKSLIEESQDGEITMAQDVLEATNTLRNFLYDEVYMRDEIHGEIQKGEELLAALYRYLMKHPGEMIETTASEVSATETAQDPLERRVVDFIAGMTDRYALDFYERIFLPRPWKLS
jgi:dGTPase